MFDIFVKFVKYVSPLNWKFGIAYNINITNTIVYIHRIEVFIFNVLLLSTTVFLKKVNNIISTLW
jgi:hypothetical protein